MSACFPATSEPTSPSIPSTRAPPSVASSSASPAVSPSGRSARARAATIAVRSSSNRSNDGVDAGLSVAMPTAIPAARSSATGATPQPRIPLERGQCATPTPCSCEERDLLVVHVDAVRRHERWAEQPRVGEHADPRDAGRRDEHVREGRPVADPVDEELALGDALGEVRRLREPERGACLVELPCARVRRMRRDAEDEALGGEVRDPPVELLEALERRRVGAEHLEVDDRANPGDGRRLGRRAREAAVADRRDPRAEALERAVRRDRAHVVEVESPLALDMEPDPRRERLPVAEAGVDGVLEVRVAVDEPGDDRAALEPLATAQLGGRPDGGDPPVVGDRHCAVRDRIALHGDDPVRGDDPHRASASASASAAERSQRRSMKTESQIDVSKSTKSGTTSRARETGSIVGRRIANVSIDT